MNPIDDVKKWIVTRNSALDDIDPELDLIENRTVDSLSFVEFLLVIEELSGVTIDRAGLDIDDFRTLSRIEKKFFAVSVDG